MSRFRLALLAIGALAIAGALRLHRVRRSPVYSLQRLADAARAKDRRGVEQYLDVRRVAESVVDAAAESSGQEEGTRPLLVTVVEQSMWTALTDSPATAPDMVGGAPDFRSLSRRYEGIADVEQRERVARVGVRLRLADVDSALVVHLRMERADGGGPWRVVGVEDLAPYLHASLEPRLERAYELEMRSDLRNLVNSEGAYFAGHGTYTQSLSRGDLTYDPTPGVSVTILEAGRDGWRAVARHQQTTAECRIAVGTAVPPGDAAGQPKCSRPGR
ncbi:MAG: hypothetical protein DMD68_13915 [Gemmatimonadetes bacterium]|nr:MAG: hypothetical protein DMD68_13915 [Gemmatimonadota bacterium]